MGKANKALRDFINDIPDSKLTGFPESGGTIYSDRDFRLDMQCKTSNGGYNLQIQINKGTTITSLRSSAPRTVAGPVLATGTESASVIRANFIALMKI
ncbi:unnamed protein product [Tuber melanosporum]|uniref:(Perigord truffle) hypothetical protein n=1 Tax=Tuber melanosporum (strain Mel28) TaxID=656061 RepID=D5GCM7_TUBMM|nr:uncharacterized protein GSTUM_00000734001 [Tuber melanosporum]CAZ82270.1 unnamed protein product [Tuber melanosporum]